MEACNCTLPGERTVGILGSSKVYGSSSDATAALRAVFNNRYFKIPEPTSCYICSHTEVYSVLITLICCFISRCVVPTSVRARRAEFTLKGLRAAFTQTAPCQSILEAQGPLGYPHTPQGCPEALHSLSFKCLSVYISFYPQLEIS